MRKANTIMLYNRSEDDVVVTLEPWAEQYVMKPGQRLDLCQTQADEPGFFEVEYYKTGITVHSGGVVRVYANGTELAPEAQWIDGAKS